MLRPATIPLPIDHQLRARINLARVIAIIGMMFVHIPPGLSQWDLVIPLQYLFAKGIHTDLTTYFGLIQSFIIEGIGRTSASLLSIIAGFLAATSITSVHQSHKRYVLKRFQSIYVPMVFWSSLTLILFGGMSLLIRPTFIDDGMAASSNPWLYLSNIVFFITDSPHGATIQLSFLRDIFMCAVLSPVLLIAVRKFPVPFILALSLIYITDLKLYIILRPLIVLGFSAGLWLAINQVNLARWDNYTRLWGGLFVLATLLLVSLKQDGLSMLAIYPTADTIMMIQNKILYPIIRLTGSVFLWCITIKIAGTSAGNSLAKLSPLLFVAYCSHVIVLGLIYAFFWTPLFGKSTTGLYSIWFFSSPILALTAAAVMLMISRRLLPGVYALITGAYGNRQRAKLV